MINSLYHPYVLGGAERSVQFLSEALAQEGHEVIVVCVIPDQDTSIEWINGVKVHYLGFKKYHLFRRDKNRKKYPLAWRILDVFNPLTASGISKILDVENPDLVHTNNLAGFSVAVWSRIKRRKLPIVHTLRDYYLICPRSTMFRKGVNCNSQCFLCKLITAPRPRLSSQVDAVVGNSRFILDKHLHFGYFLSTPIRDVIFNIYEPTAKPNPLYKSGNSPLRIGFIGRLRFAKGFHFLLTALNGLRHKAWELWVAGEKNENLETNGVHFSSSRIKLLGFVNPESFFSKIDLLVVPSLWQDPLPRTIFEAYAHGIPVIGSDRGGIPEIIENGKTGFVYPAENAQELRDRLMNFIDKPSVISMMRENCLNKSLDFSPGIIAKKYMDLYSAVLHV